VIGDEEDIPAKQQTTRQNAWISREDEDQGGPTGPQTPSCQGSQEVDPISPLGVLSLESGAVRLKARAIRTTWDGDDKPGTR